MSSTTKYILIALSLAGLILTCRILDHRYQLAAEGFPIDTCVKVDLVRGEIEYELSDRCLLVVKAFKAGRQSAVVLKPKGVL